MSPISPDVGNYVAQAIPFVGIPWKAHGRTMAGVDCYGLVRLFIESVTGVVLPDFDYDADTVRAREVVATHIIFAGRFQEVKEFRTLDIALLNYFGCASHVGVYLGSNLLLHSSSCTGTVISALTDIAGLRTMKDRIEGWYRWQSV